MSNVLQEPDYSWQDKALKKWLDCGKRGMIEAVTGSGKSHVGIEALAQLYEKDKTLSTLIVVPTVALLEQWYAKLKDRFSDKPIGRIGGSHKDSFKIPPIAYVMTIQSALRHIEQCFSHCWKNPLNRKYKCFLIADECHHYIDAPIWNKIVKPPYLWDYTLGLSATIQSYEASGLGQIIYEYRFKNAYLDGLVPSFELVNMGVDLTHQERGLYLEHTEKITDLFKKVYEQYDDLEQSPDHWIFKILQQKMGKIGSGTEPLLEKLFLTLFKRAEICYTAQKKIDLAEWTIRELIEQQKKIFVFFERIASADYVDEKIALNAANKLKNQLETNGNCECCVYHSGIKNHDRKQILDSFKKADSGVLIVCRSLDEGIDVPDADGALLVASTQSARQRIQRIGRVLRRGDGNKKPIIITLYAKGTGDDTITDADKVEFEGVANIHELVGQAAYHNIIKRIPVCFNPYPAKQHSSDEWNVLGEVEPGDERYLLKLFCHVQKGQRMKLEYHDNRTFEGKYRDYTSHTINFYGNHAPTENLIRVYIEK